MLSSSIGAATTSLIRFQGANTAVWARWSSITGKQAPMVTSAAGKTGVGLATMGGAVFGGWLGSEIAPDSMWGPMIGSVLGGVAFNQIGTWFPAIWGAVKGGFLKVISTTLGKIVAGAAGAVAAIGAVAFAIYKHRKAGEEARMALEKWEKSVNKNINGIDYSELASKTDRYLQIVNNKQLTANESLAAYIALRKEELGLIDAATNKADQDILFKDKHPDIYNPLQVMFKGIDNNIDLVKTALNGHTVNGKSIEQIPGSWNQMGYYTFNGIEYTPTSANNKYRGDQAQATGAAIAARDLYELGHSLAEGSPTYKLREDMSKLIFQSKDMEDFRISVSQLNSMLKEMKANVIPGSEYWTAEELGTKSWADVQKSYHYVHGQIHALVKAFNAPDGPYQAFKKIMTDGATDENLKNFLFRSGVDPFNVERFGEWGSDEWSKNFGFYDGVHHALKLTDPDTGEVKEYTAEQARLLLETFQNQTVEIIRMLSKNLQEKMSAFTVDYVWKPSIASQYKVGDKKTVEGLTYTWDGKMWNPPSVSTAASLSYSQMEALSKPSGNTAGTLSTTVSTGDDGSSGSSGYATSYKSSSVTPKQIIVKIENLMNVESVDMSNPNNAAVIENLRDQMAQALIDVVADFDANANAVV